jgi:hypothetical protein
MTKTPSYPPGNLIEYNILNEKLVIKARTVHFLMQVSNITGSLDIWQYISRTLKMFIFAQCRWLKPIILATQEAEIRRIMV